MTPVALKFSCLLAAVPAAARATPAGTTPAAVAAAATEETLAAGAMAWVEAPAVSRTLGQLEASPQSPLAALLLSRSSRTALKAAPDAHFVAALYGALDDASAIDWMVEMEAGSAAAALLSAVRAALTGEGFEAASTVATSLPAGGSGAAQSYTRGNSAVSLFWADGRLGLAHTPARAAAALGKLPNVQTTPGADLRGRIDVQRLYGALAKTTRGRTLAGLVDRLGLLDAISLAATVALERAKGVSAHLELLAGSGQPKGLRVVLAPPVAPERPSLPPNALGFIRVSLHPKRLYDLAQITANYLAPIEAALVRANLDALEGRLGKRLGDDVLGDAPRTWTVYVTQAAGLTTPVLLADVADTAAAGLFIKEIAAELPALFPGLEARAVAGETAEYAVYSGGREVLAIGIGKGTLVVAANTAAVRTQLRRKASQPGGRVAAAESDPAAVVAHGWLGSPGLRLALHATAAGQQILGAAQARGVSEAQVLAALGAATVSVTPNDHGYSGTVVLGGP